MDLLELLLRAAHQGHTPDVSLARHGVAGIDLDGTAAADDHRPTFLCQHCQVFREVLVGQHLQNDIHATAFAELHQFVEVAVGGMVEHTVRSFVLHQLHAAVAACGADDGHASCACQLHRRDAHTAAGAVD